MTNPSKTQDNESFVSNDTFENPALKTLANTETATDSNGIERIVTTRQDFQPAPLEATKEQIEALEKVNKTFEQASKQRLGQSKDDAGALAGDKADDDTRRQNVQGDGGSQIGGKTEAEAKQAEENRKQAQANAKKEK